MSRIRQLVHQLSGDGYFGKRDLERVARELRDRSELTELRRTIAALEKSPGALVSGQVESTLKKVADHVEWAAQKGAPVDPSIIAFYCRTLKSAIHTDYFQAHRSKVGGLSARERRRLPDARKRIPLPAHSSSSEPERLSRARSLGLHPRKTKKGPLLFRWTTPQEADRIRSGVIEVNGWGNGGHAQFAGLGLYLEDDFARWANPALLPVVFRFTQEATVVGAPGLDASRSRPEGPFSLAEWNELGIDGYEDRDQILLFNRAHLEPLSPEQSAPVIEKELVRLMEGSWGQAPQGVILAVRVAAKCLPPDKAAAFIEHHIHPLLKGEGSKPYRWLAMEELSRLDSPEALAEAVRLGTKQGDPHTLAVLAEIFRQQLRLPGAPLASLKERLLSELTSLGELPRVRRGIVRELQRASIIGPGSDELDMGPATELEGLDRLQERLSAVFRTEV